MQEDKDFDQNMQSFDNMKPPQVAPKAVADAVKDFSVLLATVLLLGGLLAYIFIEKEQFNKLKNRPIFHKKTPTIMNDSMPFALTNDKDFSTLTVDIHKHTLELFLQDDSGRVFRNFEHLKNHIENQGDELVFAMNAGMYNDKNLPVGLYVAHRERQFALNTATSGYGNFMIQPNGVFAFSPQRAVVSPTFEFAALTSPFEFATQSGPMLVVKGEINPKLPPKSTSVHIRNGVGINKFGKIILSISEKPITLYEFASYFKNILGCDNALYLDGAISKIYAPAIGKLDTTGDLGPLIGVRKLRKENVKSSGTYTFQQKQYDVYVFDAKKSDLHLFSKDSVGKYYGHFGNIYKYLASRKKPLLFATNGGSYRKDKTPEGLLVENGKILSPLNLYKGEGNFYLPFNGVFYQTTEGGIHLVRSEDFEMNERIKWANQAGPMLVYQYKVNPNFPQKSTNMLIRNAVGIAGDKIYFAIAKEKVNFYELAAFYRHFLGCHEALCLDSGLSAAYMPEIGRVQFDANVHQSVIFGVTPKF